MAAQKSISIEKIELNRIYFEVEGLTDFIANKRYPLERKKVKKDVTPEEIFEKCKYKFEDGTDGILSNAFKKAIIGATRFYKDFNMTKMNMMIHLTNELYELKYSECYMHESIVCIGSKVKSIPEVRFRAAYKDWKTIIDFIYAPSEISPEELGGILNTAGEIIGVGDWRPEKGGLYGKFKINSISIQEY